MADYEDLTNDELRDLLEERDLSTTGNKADLIARLELNDAERELEPEPEPEPEPPAPEPPAPEPEVDEDGDLPPLDLDEYDPYAHHPPQSRPKTWQRDKLPPTQNIPSKWRAAVFARVEAQEAEDAAS